MSENRFVPSRELAGEYLRESFKHEVVKNGWKKVFNSFISESLHELSHRRFLKSILSFSKKGYGKDLSECLEENIHDYSSRCLTEVSNNREFNPFFWGC